MNVPKDLESRIPSGLLTTASHRLPVNLFCFVLGSLALSSSENRNGWIYFLGAVLAPAVAAGYFIVKPFNPYRTPAAKFSGMTSRDERDSDCRRLRVLLASAGARNLLIKTSLILSALFLLVMIGITLGQSKPIGWTFHGDDVKWFALSTLTCSALTVPIYVNSLLLWSIRNWEPERSQD